MRPGGLTLGEDAQERFKELVKRESDPGKRISTVLSTMGRALWLPEDVRGFISFPLIYLIVLARGCE